MSSPQEREAALFALAVEQPAEEREAFLQAICGGDDALRQRLDALLAALAEPDLLAPAQPDRTRPTIKLDFADTPDEAVGQTLGRYKLLEKVGEGGCGVVYVAEQTQPVRRRVALKVIKLGMDTKAVVARFEAERQALAMMDHPNIAKVLDAGTTETGRPYFVMELVRGIKITDYCDQEKVSTKERLDLFIKVCQAIQHAHQKGLIHRDIKPSNILVTLHDGVPVPKVIDFGIAKATEGRLTDATVYTQLHQFIGTPAYMSPEQAEMSGLDIDTRSDIYSLGVLLYELLTGSTPFDGKELMSMGIDAMRQTIREKEPVRPSTKLATLQAEELTTTAKRRSVETSRLANLLRGDLDWIAMKCLEKDRSRRYDTANGLAMDIKRHLNNEPVVARPPSAAYKLQKAWRRNKIVYTAGAFVFLALVGGLTVASVGLKKAISAQKSEAEQRRAANKNFEDAQKAEAAADSLRIQAQKDELAARQRAYASDMNVAQQALAESNLGRALDLLNRQRPNSGQKDLRGWEWRYLWEQTHSDALFTLCRKGEIESLTVSLDGALVAIGLVHKDGLYVYNLKERREVAHLAPGEHRVRAAFSPVGPRLAFTSYKVSGSNEKRFTLRLWNAATQQMEAEIPVDELGLGLAFSKDGRQLVTVATSTVEGKITLWQIPELVQLGESYRTDPLPDLATLAGFAATSDLRLAAYGTRTGQIRIMNLRSGKEEWRSTVASEEKVIVALAFSPDDKTLASTAGWEESDIRLWDVASGNPDPVGKLEGHTSTVCSLAFWPDGKTLASSSGDQTIRIWDIPSRQFLDVLRGHRHEVWRLALLPDNRRLVSGAKDGTVCIWDTSVTHQRPARITLSEKVVAWRFTSDSRSIVTLNEEGKITQWSGVGFQDKETSDLGRKTGDLVGDSVETWKRVLFSSDCRFLAIGSINGMITVWDVYGRIPAREFNPGKGTATPLGFLARGSRLICYTSADNLLSEWDLETNRALQTWPAPPSSSFTAFSLSPDEHLGIATGWHGDVVSRKLPERDNIDLSLDALEVLGVAFTPDGKSLAIASTLGFARVWDTATWELQETLEGFLNAVFSVSFSPNGRRLATGGTNPNDALKLWDVDGWQEVLTLKVEEGEGSQFVSSAFSPDGNTVGTMSINGFLHLWQAPSWEEIDTAEAREKGGAQP